MFTQTIFAISGALLTAVAAVPMAELHHHHHPQYKRDYVWVTETQEVVQTVPVTKTVWVKPGETVPTPYSPFDDVKPAAYNPAPSPKAPAAYDPPAHNSPAKSKPKSKYVAPVPSSTSAAPAPPAYSAPPPPVYSAPPPPVYSAPPPPVYSAPVVSKYVAPTTSAAPAPAAGTPASDSLEVPLKRSKVTGIAASGTTYSGDLTYYGLGLGSCGMVSGEEDHVVAVSHEIMSLYNGANPNENPLCNVTISITGANGQKYRAMIVDTCPGCDKGSLDLSEAYFNEITNHADGRAHNMEWCFD